MTETLILLGALAVLLAVPMWVYVDAEENSPQSSLFWAGIAFVGNVVGLLLYFLLGRNPGAMKPDNPKVDEWGR